MNKNEFFISFNLRAEFDLQCSCISSSNHHNWCSKRRRRKANLEREFDSEGASHVLQRSDVVPLWIQKSGNVFLALLTPCRKLSHSKLL